MNSSKFTIKNFSLKEKTEMIKLYKEGLTCAAIAKIFNCSGNSIKYILVKNNIKLKSKSETSRIYQMNHNYFNKIDTQNKAYFLGFLYADGTVCLRNNTIRLSLAEKDIEILEKIKVDVESNKQIRINKIKHYLNSFYSKHNTAFFGFNFSHTN